jgi:2-dehydro-3-deoxygluconokinase
MKKFDVIALGIAVVDILARPVDKSVFDRDNTAIDEIDVCPGGDAANQAVNISKLGLLVSLCCRLGADSMGDLFLSAVKSHGVDTSHAAVSASSRTSTAIALVSQSGDRNIICRRGNNYDFCFRDIDLEFIKNARALSVGSLYGMPKLEEDGGLLAALQAAKEGGLVTFADMGSDKKGQKLKGIAPFLPYIDYFLPSEKDSRNLSGTDDCEEAAKAFLDAGVKNVVIKLGKRGAYAHTAGYRGYVNPYNIRPVDTTGAGDAFCSGMICGVLNGLDIRRTLDFAAACGAFNSLFLGANTSPLSAEAVREFMKNTPRTKIY